MSLLRTRAAQAVARQLGLSALIDDQITKRLTHREREHSRTVERQEKQIDKLKTLLADQKRRSKTLEHRLVSTVRQTQQVAQLLNASSRTIETLARTHRPRIAIIVTFFGPPPFWLPAFFLSCRQNPSVTWIIYTDFHVAMPLPPNVTLKKMGIYDLEVRASKVLGTEIALVNRRKICDLKPVYGLIFADDIQPFDFWAYSDLDIIWGNIRQFVTDVILEQNDIVSSRGKKLSGHFTLVRNTARTNRLFELIPNVEQKMADSRYLHLDEHELTSHLKKHLATAPSYVSLRVHWARELTVDAAYQRALGAHANATLWWRDGKTFDADGQEVMYLHFHKLKQTMNAINFGFDDTPVAFKVNSTGVWV